MRSYTLAKAIFCLSAASAAADATLDDDRVLAADDECLSTEAGDAACALNAIQLRGQAKAAPAPAVSEYTPAERAAHATDLAAEALEAVNLAAEAAEAVALELGDASADEEGDATQNSTKLPAAEVKAALANASNLAEAVKIAEQVLAKEEVAQADAEIPADDAVVQELEEDAQEAHEEALDELPVEVVQEEASRADTYPDLSTGPDTEGPYEEEPTEEQEKNPKPADMSLVQMKAGQTYSDSFCASHHTGTFCSDTTQIRCCKASYGYVKCGSTWHSSTCGWHEPGYGGGGYDSRRRYYSSYDTYDSRRRYSYYDDRRRYYNSVSSGSAWTVHPGWHSSTFCTAHHVGSFCSNHRKIQCCSDRGHYVDCTTRQETNYYC